MNFENKIIVSVLNQYYGRLLTAQQREFVNLHYDCDVTLNEIAEQNGITRQAVKDSLKRAENSLRQFDEHLGFVDKLNKVEIRLENLKDKFLDRKDIVEDINDIIAELEGKDGRIQ